MPHSASVIANSSAIFSPSFRPENLTLIFHTSPSTSPSSMSFVSVINRNNIANGDPMAMNLADVFARRSGHLKRKRPPTIHIPVAPLGYLVESPPARNLVDEARDEGVGYCAYSKRGRRGGPLEDRYSAIVDICRDTKQDVFGVFDGHGGAKASEFASKNLNRNIVAALSSTAWKEEMKDAIRDAYLTTDEEFLKLDVNGGSCCVTAAFKNGNLAVSNVGDCRAVISRKGVAEALTSDHKASRDDERDRIEALGGYVDDCRGIWRIQGSLAVSRGVGDSHLKKWVIAEPETTVLKIEPDQEFLILASDGLWDKVTNQEAVDIVRSFCNGEEEVAGLSRACNRMAELSISRGCIDDITVLIIQLGVYIS